MFQLTVIQIFGAGEAIDRKLGIFTPAARSAILSTDFTLWCNGERRDAKLTATDGVTGDGDGGCLSELQAASNALDSRSFLYFTCSVVFCFGENVTGRRNLNCLSWFLQLKRADKPGAPRWGFRCFREFLACVWYWSSLEQQQQSFSFQNLASPE